MATGIQPLQKTSDCIEVVKHYIRDHLQEQLDRETLAAVAGFSIPHFHRVFTAQVGESAASYIRRLRLERAGRKLRMGAVDITEVALCRGIRFPCRVQQGIQTAVRYKSEGVPSAWLHCGHPAP